MQERRETSQINRPIAFVLTNAGAGVKALTALVQTVHNCLSVSVLIAIVMTSAGAGAKASVTTNAGAGVKALSALV